MHKILDKDKIIWKFYTSNLNSIKKSIKRKPNLRKFPVISKVLKSNINLELDPKTKNIHRKKIDIDALVDLHGKTEVQAYEVTKNFIKNSYMNGLEVFL